MANPTLVFDIEPVTTSGNVADITQTHHLLQGEEQSVHLDAGYIGVQKRAEVIQDQRHLGPGQTSDCRYPMVSRRTGVARRMHVRVSWDPTTIRSILPTAS